MNDHNSLSCLRYWVDPMVDLLEDQVGGSVGCGSGEDLFLTGLFWALAPYAGKAAF